MPPKPTPPRPVRCEKEILRAARRTIAQNAMIRSGDSILVAVSGGADSMALVHVLVALAPGLSARLAIAHLNHGLRSKEADRDAEFVASVAQNLNLPLFLDKIDTRNHQERYRLSPEEAARNVRYDFLNRVAEKNGFTKIAVGHHLDDNAELVLMFLLRGSGPLGLSGMPPVRDSKIIRPLIDIKRSKILEYLALKNLQYVSDSSNTDFNFLRNKIRHELIPQLARNYNPNIVNTLNRLASVARSEESWIDTIVDPLYHRALMKENTASVRLSQESLEYIPLAARRRVIRKAIKRVKGNLRRIAFSHIDAAVRLALKGPHAGSIDLPDRVQVQRDHQALVIIKQSKPLRLPGSGKAPYDQAAYSYEIKSPGSVFIQEAGVHLRLTEVDTEAFAHCRGTGQGIAFFDINKVKFPLLVRNFQPGDRFSPLGMTGTQKLKKFFNSSKIPRAQRAICPLLVSDGRIIWVAGHRLDNSVKVDADTRGVLKAELLLA